MAEKLELQAVLDALGHGVLIYSNDGRLIQHNIMSATILGADLNLIKSKGWTATSALFDAGLQTDDLNLNAVKEQAMQSDQPIRFKVYRLVYPLWGLLLSTEYNYPLFGS